nr:hypothetical protein SEVIR_9G487050v2 [Setaria viridis]
MKDPASAKRAGTATARSRRSPPACPALVAVALPPPALRYLSSTTATSKRRRRCGDALRCSVGRRSGRRQAAA